MQVCIQAPRRVGPVSTFTLKQFETGELKALEVLAEHARRDQRLVFAQLGEAQLEYEFVRLGGANPFPDTRDRPSCRNYQDSGESRCGRQDVARSLAPRRRPALTRTAGGGGKATDSHPTAGARGIGPRRGTWLPDAVVLLDHFYIAIADTHVLTKQGRGLSAVGDRRRGAARFRTRRRATGTRPARAVPSPADHPRSRRRHRSPSLQRAARLPDALYAAPEMPHGLVLATRNTRRFRCGEGLRMFAV